MIRRQPRSTRTDTLVPTRRSSDLGDRRGAIGAGRDIAFDIAALADTPIGDGDDSAFAILAIPGDPASRRAGMHRAGGLIEVGKARIVRWVLEHRHVAQLANTPRPGGRTYGVGRV